MTEAELVDQLAQGIISLDYLMGCIYRPNYSTREFVKAFLREINNRQAMLDQYESLLIKLRVDEKSDFTEELHHEIVKLLNGEFK